MHQDFFKTYFYMLKKSCLLKVREDNEGRMEENSVFMYEFCYDR